MNSPKKRILLIQPPFYRLYKSNFSIHFNPLSLAYLAGAILRETDWEPVAYNADFHPHPEPMDSYGYLTGDGFRNYLSNVRNKEYVVWQEILRTILDTQPAVVGISATSQNFAAACMIAELVKWVGKEITVILGGPHASMVRGEVLSKADIDIAVFGEGESTIVHILRALDVSADMTGIPGVIYRDNGRVRENPPRELIVDLDPLPFPIVTLPKVMKDFDKYPTKAFQNIFSSRGCPYECSFCGSRYIWSRRVRYRSIDNIVAEIREMLAAGINHIYFADDTFGLKKAHTLALCEKIIQDCPGLLWQCEMNVKLVSEDLVTTMARAGCRTIQLGVESGNNAMLKKIGKHITIEQARAAAATIRKTGLRVEAFFMVGFPHETEETLHDTIQAIRDFPCDSVIYSIFTPYPGSELFDYCKEQGIISDTFDVALYNHQSPENYFCPNIPRERFHARLRELEQEIDRLHQQRKTRNAKRNRLLGPTSLVTRGYSLWRDKGLSGVLAKLREKVKGTP